MPELPEVETVKRTLEPFLQKRTIVKTEVFLPRLIKKQSVEVFLERTEQFHMQTITRRGKFIIVHGIKQKEPLQMIVHLGMTGACFVVSSLEEIPKKFKNAIHIIFSLDDGKLFTYCDVRTFGGLRIFTKEEYENKTMNATILKMGPEPFDKHAQSLFLSNLDKATYQQKTIKEMIMKQEVIAGVGNIYACEALFHVNILPHTFVKDITKSQKEALLKEIQRILAFSIEVKGSSISDYVDAKGEKGSFQDHFYVYSQKYCKTCGTPIENIKLDNRSSFYCPSCQK